MTVHRRGQTIRGPPDARLETGQERKKMEDKSYKSIRVERNGPIAEVVLDRPEALNAMRISFFYEIKRAFEEIAADDNIRVTVLRAEGRLFTAGLDLKEAASGVLGSGSNGSGSSLASTNLSAYQGIKNLQDCFTAIEHCPKPVIAAVHGKCLGGGIDLITACDFRVCTADASFSIFETKIAIVADVGTLQRITPIVGKGMAREMAYTGAFVGAERALACGLVNAVYQDKEAMLEGARATAAEIAANSPLAVQGTKMVLGYSEEHTIAEGLEHVAQWNSSFLLSKDLEEAIKAFAEKRVPEFKGY